MNVRLFVFPDNLLSIIANAARKTIKSTATDKSSDAALVSYLVDSNETSPLEHANLSFEISGISRVCIQQLTRHRIASYSQESMRYVKPEDIVLPPNVPSDALASYMLKEHYASCVSMYETLINLGVDMDSARYALPMGTSGSIIVTMNCRSLLNFFSQRLCGRASKEIRVLAQKMHAIASSILPEVFDRKLLDCEVYGRCRKRKSCKKTQQTQ